MIYIKTEVRESHIPGAGKGLFTLEPVKAGQIIANFVLQCNVMTEEEYQEEQRKENMVIIKTAVRWVGTCFIYKDTIDKEDYINHSSNPNILYHCGICFANKNINTGEELTVDYKYFLAENDVYAFAGGKNNKMVDGLPGRKALLESAKELVTLLKEVEEKEQ